jgi:hypothetical protein
MIARGAGVLAVLSALLLALVAASSHASRLAARRSGDQAAMVIVLRALPGPDLVLAGGARHLRSLTMAEPGAAFADAPSALDDDPAGGAISAPRDAWAGEARRGR